MSLRSRLLLIAALLMFVQSCAKSPMGRNQLKLFSSSQLANMGTQAFDGMKSNQKVSSAGKQNEYVRCVAQTLIPHVPQDVFRGEWEIVVFDEDQVNAFALPGGKIGVYTGLLNVTENQDQLAAVIGHEIGHVIAEHGNERMSNSTLIGVGLEVTNQVLKSNEVASNGSIMAALGLGLQLGVQLPFSRTHETEADLIGLELMAKAGFDPRESISLWENMAKASGGNRQPEFLSTHPLPSTRIKQLLAHMDKALAMKANRPATERCIRE